jgi:hypothetical protein
MLTLERLEDRCLPSLLHLAPVAIPHGYIIHWTPPVTAQLFEIKVWDSKYPPEDTVLPMGTGPLNSPLNAVSTGHIREIGVRVYDGNQWSAWEYLNFAPFPNHIRLHGRLL